MSSHTHAQKHMFCTHGKIKTSVRVWVKFVSVILARASALFSISLVPEMEVKNGGKQEKKASHAPNKKITAESKISFTAPSLNAQPDHKKTPKQNTTSIGNVSLHDIPDQMQINK